MATTTGRRLTEAHRLAQVRLSAKVAAELTQVWPLLDPTDLDRTVRRWLAATVPIIQGGRSTSAELAATYLAKFRTAELGEAIEATLAEPLPREQIATSLVVTGPISLRAATARGGLTAQAIGIARARTASAGMRHALNGGRDTITSTTGADPQARGWARVTSGRACSFCSDLASRGAVYGEDTVNFEAHDHCSCSAEPVYG